MQDGDVVLGANGQSRRQLRKLEERRVEALSVVYDQRARFESMESRCVGSKEPPDADVINIFRQGMNECERKVRETQDIGEFDSLTYTAESLGHMRAYICPLVEIYTQASTSVDLMEDWGVSPSGLAPLRKLIQEKLSTPMNNPEEARSLLWAILRELDVWDDYTEEYERDTRRISVTLLGVLCGLFILSVLTLYFCRIFAPLFSFSLFLAGGVGSCASVLARMPASEVTSSSASVSLIRRTISRVATGMVASIAGSALLGWLLPIAVNKVSFADVILKCGPYSQGGCSATYSVVAIAIPIMLGFSERILTSLEDKLFGRAGSAVTAGR